MKFPKHCIFLLKKPAPYSSKIFPYSSTKAFQSLQSAFQTQPNEVYSIVHSDFRYIELKLPCQSQSRLVSKIPVQCTENLSTSLDRAR